MEYYRFLIYARGLLNKFKMKNSMENNINNSQHNLNLTSTLKDYENELNNGDLLRSLINILIPYLSANTFLQLSNEHKSAIIDQYIKESSFLLKEEYKILFSLILVIKDLESYIEKNQHLTLSNQPITSQNNSQYNSQDSDITQENKEDIKENIQIEEEKLESQLTQILYDSNSYQFSADIKRVTYCFTQEALSQIQNILEREMIQRQICIKFSANAVYRAVNSKRPNLADRDKISVGTCYNVLRENIPVEQASLIKVINYLSLFFDISSEEHTQKIIQSIKMTRQIRKIKKTTK
jgi:hypothetical protein